MYLKPSLLLDFIKRFEFNNFNSCSTSFDAPLENESTRVDYTTNSTTSSKVPPELNSYQICKNLERLNYGIDLLEAILAKELEPEQIDYGIETIVSSCSQEQNSELNEGCNLFD